MSSTIKSHGSSLRIYSIDYLRIVAFCGVVALHTVSPDGELSTAVNILSRFGVPYFFIIAGLFFNPSRPIRQKLISLGTIGCTAGTVYVILGVLGITPWFTSLMGSDNVINDLLSQIRTFLLWNSFPPAYPLWFIFALLYVYGVYGCLSSFGVSKSSIASFSLGLFFARTIFGEVLGAMSPQDVVMRSWLFLGLPCFSMGVILRQHLNKLTSINSIALFVLAAIGIILSGIEYSLFGLQECYIGMLLCTIVTIIYCFKHPFSTSASKPFASYVIGGRYCLVAYLVHYGVICLLQGLLKYLFPMVDGLYQITLLVGTVSISLAVSLLISVGSGLVKQYEC